MSARFWNRIADKYAAQPVEDEQAYQRKLKLTQERLTPDMNVLEFGCGTGTTAIAHAPHVRSILATDISPRMIEIGREKARARSVTNVEFEVVEIDRLDRPPESFDAILGMSIMHLVRDRAAVLARVRRLLKPGGRFYTSTPCIADISPLLALALPAVGLTGLIPRVKAFGKDQWLAELTKAGFEIELDWQPAPGKALFAIARKPATT